MQLKGQLEGQLKDLRAKMKEQALRAQIDNKLARMEERMRRAELAAEMKAKLEAQMKDMRAEIKEQAMLQQMHALGSAGRLESEQTDFGCSGIRKRVV